jgi:hypothetical protein
MHDKKDILKHVIGKLTHQTKPPESEDEDLNIQHNIMVFFCSYIPLFNPCNELSFAQPEMVHTRI